MAEFKIRLPVLDGRRKSLRMAVKAAHSLYFGFPVESYNRGPFKRHVHCVLETIGR